MNDRTRFPVRGAVRVGGVFLAALLLVAGVFVGRRWQAHDETAHDDTPRGNTARADVSRSTTAAATDTRSLWTCSMHPQVIQDHPGLCPICHMALTPLDLKANVSGLAIDPTVVQSMGVRTVRVVQTSLARAIRTVGTLVEREADHRDVNLRVSGWVQSLAANTDGMSVVEGAPLFDLYSPELSVAIEELIAARRQREASATSSAEGSRSLSDTLFATARKRLELMGIAASEVERLAALDAAPATVTFTSPMTGHVVERTIYAGAAVKAGDRVLRIADNTTLWIDARVYERDFADVQAGAEVRVHVDAYPSETFRGHVLFVHPHLDMETRTALVRAEIANTAMRLREGMYATVEIDTPTVNDALVVPREAVIDTGTRQVVFVALPENKFELRTVEIGARGDAGLVQIRSGLAALDSVVVSGQYLLDSESRMREAVRKFLAPGEQSFDPAQARSTPATQHETKILAHPEWSAEIDAVFAAYLQLSDGLGAVENSASPLDAAKFANAVRALATRSRGSDAEVLTSALDKATQPLIGATLAEQRKLFGATSEAAIDLASAITPSQTVAPHLYVIRCTMAPGSWIQSTADVHNPFYGTAMKNCGELVRTLDTARSEIK